MIFNTKATQKNACQKLDDISLNKDMSNQLWSELSETSEAAVSGGSPAVIFLFSTTGTLSLKGGALISFDDRGN